MYKVIKAAVFDNEPHVVKAPEPLFIINTSPDDPTADKNNGLKEDHQYRLDEATQKRNSIEDDIKKLENELNDKQLKIKALRGKADLIMKEAQDGREKILHEAEKISAEKIKEANDKVIEITQNAKNTGHDQGYKEGLEQSRSEQENLINAANEKAVRIIDEAEKQVDACYKDAEKDMTDIVMAVSLKIISQQFANMPQLVLPVVQEALKKVKNQTSVEVRVSPNTYEFALAARSELQSILEGNARLTIQSDESLTDGDCWVETPDGSIDAKLLSQLSEIQKMLKEVVGKYEANGR
ncbi:FliH/SctL family protein [Pectinatus haikarae]|uniref:Flagellar assembly protein FliH n=1 Tax=Pectinatus haikarae TaxID=349096 RepID=A0ABT9Y7H1_9FIRM|nr:FliH/SctL family protein [Pectinatus haikarae]MDQ0203782.1 flagellar assembly protein FliH [Pectinatus haikarae]